ncbi:MAG: DUF3857 domain-containing protein [Bacteroidales bacterium]|nr:DUF3857 domain-containing protein [Bacteroidales bacterium]
MLACCALHVMPAVAQIYTMNSIPDSLKENANAVYLINNTEYERKSLAGYTIKRHIVVAVLNEKGRDEALLAIYYDQNTRVGSIKGCFYNPAGAKIAKIEKKDIQDVSACQDVFFSDSRLKTFLPAINQCPYIVEYEYNIHNNAVIGFDVWVPRPNYNTSVISATLTFNSQADLMPKV